MANWLMDADELKDRTQRAMPNVAAWPDPASFVFGPIAGERHDAKNIFVPAVFYALKGVLGFSSFGRGEKVAWELCFKYKGIRCALALQKFGLRLYMSRDDLRQHQASPDVILRELRAGAAVVERHLLQPLVEDAIERAHITITNRYHLLRDMYLFHRRLAQRGMRKKTGDTNGVRDFFDELSRSMRHERRRSYHIVAASNAFFSTLEHLLVLLFALRTENLGGQDLVHFMRAAKWWEKFKRVVDINDSVAKRLYDQLRDVADIYRNPYSHGLIGRDKSILHAQVPGVGAIPAVLSEWERAPHLYSPFAHMDPAAIFDVFDACDRLLTEGVNGIWLRYVDSGLDVPCDPGSRKKLLEASVEPEQMDQLIQAWSYVSDQAVNMDW